MQISRELARIYSDCLARLHAARSDSDIAVAWIQAKHALLGENGARPHHDAKRPGGAEWLYGLYIEQLQRKQAALLAQPPQLTPDEQLLEILTRREKEVLHHVSLGQTNTIIAHALRISPKTANKHVENILHKLRVETRTAAAGIWLSRGKAESGPPP